MALRALAAKPSIVASMSSRSIALVEKWLDGSGICDGAQSMMRRVLERGMAAMRELAEDLRAVRVHACGELAVEGHDRRVPGADEAARHLSGRMHRLALEDDQPGAAARARLVIGDMIVRAHAVEVRRAR